jgi:N-acetylmuramoyl-L-alanine amidase
VRLGPISKEGSRKFRLVRTHASAWALATAGVIATSAAAAKPGIVDDHISYGDQRRGQMAGYSERHYGEREWRLRDPDAIVLHYVVKQGGKIAELVPPRIRCRHTIGLNHRSIGIEMVQEAGAGPAWADRQILERKPQIRAALRLVDWLQRRFGIATGDVIGHSMANDSPYFKDLRGWRNDHSDWLKKDVRVFRKRLGRL